MVLMQFIVQSLGWILCLIAAFSAGSPNASKPVGYKTLKPFIEAYQCALEVGDVESVGYSAADYVVSSYFVGKELANLEREMATYHAQVFQLKQNAPLTWIKINWQVILNLLETKSQTLPDNLMGNAYPEKNQLSHLLEIKDGFALFLLYFNLVI